MIKSFCRSPRHEIAGRRGDERRYLKGKLLQVAAHCTDARYTKILDIIDHSLEVCHQPKCSRYLFGAQGCVE